jgi:hypothetical protein
MVCTEQRAVWAKLVSAGLVLAPIDVFVPGRSLFGSSLSDCSVYAPYWQPVGESVVSSSLTLDTCFVAGKKQRVEAQPELHTSAIC